jgi:hypothetical protein
LKKKAAFADIPLEESEVYDMYVQQLARFYAILIERRTMSSQIGNMKFCFAVSLFLYVIRYYKKTVIQMDDNEYLVGDPTIIIILEKPLSYGL